MKILVLNCGSSSIKYKLFDMTTKEVIAQGGIEKIGLKGSFLKLTLPNGEKKILEKDIPEHTVGVEFILNTLISPEYGAIKSLDEINAVGHRMVHGGERFSESVLLNKEVLDAFIACNDLAPLHNPANLKGVNAVSAILPNVPQVGVFDTAFHQTMPDYAYMYAIPYELYEKYGVRRMASMELLIAMFHNVYANSLALIRKERKLSLATSVTVVPFQLSKMVNV